MSLATHVGRASVDRWFRGELPLFPDEEGPLVIRHQRTQESTTAEPLAGPMAEARMGVDAAPGVRGTAVDRSRQLGASLIEYVLMIALVAIVCVGALSYFGGASKNSSGRSAKCIETAGTPNYVCPDP
jgi:Flp pilus assembly pilin Flp